MVDLKPTSFSDVSVANLLELLASPAPAPGGGAASAIAAAIGASLVAMVAGLSTGRDRYAAHAATHAEAQAAGRELMTRLARIADEDSAAYDAFAVALKMPRETDDEREARSRAMRESARVAARVPLACVEACAEVTAAAEMLAGRSNRNASSDLAVATLLAEAGAQGAAENVLVNLSSIGDEAEAADLRRRTEESLASVRALGERTRAVVSSGEERAPLPTSAT